MNRLIQFASEVQQRLEEIAAGTIAQHLEWTLRDADKLCESEIEKFFLLAWVEKLEQYRIQGWFRGWMSSYHISNGIAGCPPLEMVIKEKLYCSLIREGADQVDLVYPQQVIGKYRADFVLIRLRYGYTDSLEKPERTCEVMAKVVVECDGHEFHEKTKEQAKRDKARDRFLQTEGYYVLRFTGSELYNNPARCADEVEDFFEKKWPRKD